jgi:multidrug efflux pump subunit AcrB
VDKVRFPDAAEDPEIINLESSGQFPMLNVVVSGELPEKQLKAIVDDLEDAIQEIKEVGTITIAGVRDRKYGWK